MPIIERNHVTSEAQVAIIGENLVDLFVAPDGKVQAFIGGGPLNVARCVTRLGCRTLFVSGISGDAFGKMIRSDLDENGVELALPDDSALPTSIAVVELTDGVANYFFHLQSTAAFEISGAVALPHECRAIYVGTLGLVIEPMASRGEELIAAASPSTLVVIDPNCRPNATIAAQLFRDRVRRLLARADVVKVSVEDLAFLYPSLSREEGVQQLLHDGARLIVVSDGPHPIEAASPHWRISVPVPVTAIVDTVGAGDALVGGFIAWWLGHHLSREELSSVETVTQALRAAVEISRRTCMRAGATSPHASEIRDLDAWSWL